MDAKQQPPYPLRMPAEVREQLAAAAEANGRSLNAEIVLRLESSLTGKPNIQWVPGGAPKDLIERHPVQDEMLSELNAVSMDALRGAVEQISRVLDDIKKIQPMAELPPPSKKPGLRRMDVSGHKRRA